MDEERYGKLLAEVRPRLVETHEEHERLLAVAERLMEKGELGEEEENLLALIVLLIEAYEVSFTAEEEESEEAEEVPAPHVTLQRLMFSHDMKVDDVAHVFGNPHLAKEVVEGTRAISKRQAKELGKFFRVPARLFAPGA